MRNKYIYLVVEHETLNYPNNRDYVRYCCDSYLKALAYKNTMALFSYSEFEIQKFVLK